jgi:hypothetical protein
MQITFILENKPANPAGFSFSPRRHFLHAGSFSTAGSFGTLAGKLGASAPL